MGSNHSTRKDSFDPNGEVDFDHFQILRAIGKGSFGKVCIIQKKDSKKMFAMKYMNKPLIIKKEAVRNVIREMDLLRALEHPFIVNLWFTFQDEEDMFMVVDLLLGGDLRYHIQQDVKFDEDRVKLYICEIALALDYLKSHHILHRDIKPDNVLLDEGGHVHLTDFNIATVLEDGAMSTSMSGTKPYMAPEVFATALEQMPGYSFPFDWWSTGVCAYEMLKGRRPYEIHSNTSVSDVHQMFLKTGVHYPSAWEQGMKDLIKDLIKINPEERLSTLEELKRHPYMQDVDFDKVYRKETKPSFVPAKDHLNCDPTFELEEMIIEAKPLHKKKKRLAKNNKKNKQTDKENQPPDPLQVSLDNITKDFKSYNREVELAEIEKKKQQELEASRVKAEEPTTKNSTNTETLQPTEKNSEKEANPTANSEEAQTEKTLDGPTTEQNTDVQS